MPASIDILYFNRWCMEHIKAVTGGANFYIMDLQTVKAELLANPLFHFSLGSKELFHSNFWYWLGTLDPLETARLFLPTVRDGQLCTFKREETKGAKKGQKAQVDLVLYVDGKKALVIENKTKDIVKQNQIERIQRNHQNSAGDIKFLLVTLFDHYVSLDSNWALLRYDELANRIDISRFKIGEYEKLSLERYKAFLCSLHHLQQSLPITDSYDFTEKAAPNLFHQLNEIKFWETYVKMRGHVFASQYISSRKERTVQTLVTVNRKKVTIDFYFPLDNEGRIGVQIEDGRICKFINKAKNKVDFHLDMAKSNLYFDSAYLTPRKKQFGKFNPDFYYQYVKLANKLKEEQVFKEVDACLDVIDKNLISILALVK